MSSGERSEAVDGIPALGGHHGPVLVIADNAAIARRALAWAAAFAAHGRPHRVRLVGPAAGDVDALVAEAVGWKATAILAASGETARRAAEALAARLGLPLVIDREPEFPAQ